MKAIFKLSAAQVSKARALEVVVAGEIARGDKEQAVYNGFDPRRDSRMIDCGLYILETHGGTNPHQAVYLERNTLVVEGHRCALMQDGGFDVAEGIIGKGAVPTRYETSDARLRWNETLEGYIKTRATREERVDYVLDGRSAQWRWFLPELLPVVRELTRSPERANAQFEDADIRIARKICSI